MVLKERPIIELIEELRERRWSDAGIGKELDVSAVTVWRWRQGYRQIGRPKLIRRALEALLGRP